MCLLSMCTHSFLFSLTLCASIPFSRLLELWSRMIMKGRPNSSNASAGVPLIVAIRALAAATWRITCAYLRLRSLPDPVPHAQIYFAISKYNNVSYSHVHIYSCQVIIYAPVHVPLFSLFSPFSPLFCPRHEK